MEGFIKEKKDLKKSNTRKVKAGPVKSFHLARFHTSFSLHMMAHKNSWYREWHQWRFSHHFHIFMLVFYLLMIILGSLGLFLPNDRALAASKSWSFNEGVPSDYYNYGAKVDVGGGTAALGSHTPGADWIADSGGDHFHFRKQITITNSGSALTDYQVLFDGLDTTGCFQANCEDLRFTSDVTTSINYWIESGAKTASTKVWVKVPSIGTPNETIYMYYGNSSASAGSSYDNTFTKDYGESGLVGLWHMDEGADDTCVGGEDACDSSSTGNDGTSGVAPANPLWFGTDGGQWGGRSDMTFSSGNALVFDGGDDIVTVPDNTAYDLGTGPVSFSFWFKPDQMFDSSKATQTFISKYKDNYNNFFISLAGANYPSGFGTRGAIVFALDSGGAYPYYSTATDSWQANQWYHIVFTRNAGTYQVFVNGDKESGVLQGASPATASFDPVVGDLKLGGDFAESANNVVPAWFDGTLDEVRVYNRVLDDTEVLRQYERSKYASAAPTVSVTTINAANPDGYYYNDYPTIQNEETGNGVSLSYISAMSITTSGTGSVRFQITPDNGTTWYRWNGSVWVTIASPDTYDASKTNTASEVTTNITEFRPGGSNPYNFRWRAFFVSDGSQTATITNVSITYQVDTTAPSNPVTGDVTCYESDGGSTWIYDSGQKWHNYPAPKFTWTEPSDTGNPDASGIWKYYAKLDIDSNYDPDEYDETISPSLIAGSLANGQKYYFRINTVDNAMNTTLSGTTLLEYWYDNVAPTDPSNLQANTLQPTDQPLSFSWNASTDVGTIGQRSEFDHYEYKVGSISGWQTTTSTSVSGIVGDEDGANTFRVKAIDKAGNESGEDTIVYNYILNAPSEPLNLTVTDQSKTVNDFEFSWNAPSYVEPGNAIAGYRFFVNELPSASPQNNYSYMGANGNDLGNVVTINGIRATQQGVNRLYLVAYDDDSPSKINYSNYAWKDFSIDTTATALTAPQTVVISDVSDRHKPDHYALAMSWKAPDNYSASTFGHYNIRRTTSLTGLDTDGDWLALTPVATASTPAYAEAGLTKDQTYYYRISGVDNAGAELVTSLSVIVQKAPTGKYIEPPTDSLPVVSVTATTATITWTTDRVSYSKVEYGKTGSYGMQNSSLQTSTNHSVTLYGLDPGVVYHYRTQSLDPSDQEDYDNSLAYSASFTFQTQPAPGISEVKISDIRLNSALITWKTTSSATSTLKYGKTNTYGKELTDSSGSAVTTHTVKLSDLDHSSTYHFKIFGADTDGNVMQSDDYNFDTLTFPKVSDIKLEQMKSTATATMKVTWESNVPVTSVVQYTDSTGKTLEAAQSELKTVHELVISGLKDNTDYTMVVKGRDAYGNVGSSGSEKFKTDFDTRPPKISEITTETSINGYGAGAKSQMVVSWYTDEPSTSQIQYSKGVTGDTYSMSTQEDAMLTTSHVVVVSDLDPSSSYYFRVVSKDSSGNEAKSDANSALTEEARSSIFDLVLKSFESTLGWLFGG